MQEDRVRQAFRDQAASCERLGSPFTARLLMTIEPLLDRTTQTGRTILEWTGPPDAQGDAVPLRIAGGLHALVRAGRLPNLAALYPSHPMPSAAELRDALAAVLRDHDASLRPWLDLAPQTNEVARAAVLYPGLMAVARLTGLPLAVYEVGASAGLNLMLDGYAYLLGGRAVGDTTSAVRLSPKWEGPDPAGTPPVIVTRRGCDMAPIDVTQADDRDRLRAYIWPDQDDRHARLTAAIELARANPPVIDRADAGEWVERSITADPPRGVARVLMHSITFQYLSDDAQRRIREHMETVGAQAGPNAALAWLAFEMHDGLSPRLTLRLWPGDGEIHLAVADAHGRKVTWVQH
jgi:hypothetical protein